MTEGRRAGRRFWLFAAALTTMLFSCGIDIISVLDSPPIYESNLVFKAPLNPDPALYYGVDLFYRIYAIEEDAAADKDKLLAKQTQANALPGDAINNYLLSDSGLKYKRLRVNQDAPSLKKDFLNGYKAQISYNAPIPNELALRLDDDFEDPIAQTITLFRSNDAKSGFSLRPLDGDTDYQSNPVDPDVNRYFIQFFAASYGIDIANGSFNDLYSNAISLGIQIIDYF